MKQEECCHEPEADNRYGKTDGIGSNNAQRSALCAGFRVPDGTFYDASITRLPGTNHG
jgi:hypothetical protein